MRKRVLHVLEALEGGTARHLQDVVSWTPDVDHHVAVPHRRVGGLTDVHAIPAMLKAGATVHEVPMTRRPPSFQNSRALVTLISLSRRLNTDVMHGHSSVGGALARLAATAVGTARVYTPNGLHTHAASIHLERQLGRLTDRFIAVSDSERDLAQRLGLIQPDRLRVIPNGIDPARPHAGPDLRALAGVRPGAPLVLSVGRLVPQKEPLAVVETMARVLRKQPGAEALLIGDGPLSAPVRAAIEASGLRDRLHWLKVVEGVSAGMGAADVFLLLSGYEGGPYVPLEAQRASVPVVATDVVGTRDVIRDGVTGFLVPHGDPGAAATAVCLLLNDEPLRQRLGAAGKVDVGTLHSASRMGQALAALYTEVLAERVVRG